MFFLIRLPNGDMIRLEGVPTPMFKHRRLSVKPQYEPEEVEAMLNAQDVIAYLEKMWNAK